MTKSTKKKNIKTRKKDPNQILKEQVKRKYPRAYEFIYEGKGPLLDPKYYNTKPASS